MLAGDEKADAAYLTPWNRAALARTDTSSGSPQLKPSARTQRWQPGQLAVATAKAIALDTAPPGPLEIERSRAMHSVGVAAAARLLGGSDSLTSKPPSAPSF
jgi:hypothetical protein